MLDQLGLRRRDGQTMLAVAAIVAATVALFHGEQTVPVRIVTGVLAGGISAAVFLVLTLIINQFKPDRW